MNENLDLHPVSLEFEPLAKLKSLSISNYLDDIGNFPFLNHSSEASSPIALNSSVKDLGFVSPCKASPIVSKGYYLRSCSKSFQEIPRPVKDKPGFQKVDKDQNGDVKDLHSVSSCVGALRASALKKVSI